MNPFVSDLLAQLDRRLPRALYRWVSVDAERFRSQLRAAGRPHADPRRPHPPLADLDRTAAWLVERAARDRSLTGGLAALSGAPSAPSALTADALHTLRLAQRLALVYGLDPKDDRGQAALWYALAAGLRVSLPARGEVELAASDLPRLSARAETSVPAALTLALLRQAARPLRRLRRLLPVVGAPAAAREGAARVLDRGERMIATLRQLYEPPPPLDPLDIDECGA